MLFNLFNRESQSKKKKRSKKKELSDESKSVIRKSVIIIILSATLVFLIVLGVSQIFSYITNWDYFSLEHIEIRGENLSTKEAARYCDIELPQNTISLSIDDLANHTKKIHPDLKQVKIERKLPNTLIVVIDRRKPVAQAEVRGEYYLVDSECFIICKLDSKQKDVPLISGLRSSEINDTKDGICISEKLNTALGLFDIYKSIITERTHQIESIDVSNSRNYVLFVSHGLEIRLGRDAFEAKIKNLLLILGENSIPDNSYIDLRFKNVTVAPRKK